MTVVLAHLLAAFAMLVAPLLSYRKVRQLRRGDTPPDKTRLYRHTVVMQSAVTASVAGLWLLCRVPQ